MYGSYFRFNLVYQTHLYASVLPQAVRGGLASLARLFCYMHHHMVYEGACSDVAHRAILTVCCWNGKETPYQGPKVQRVAYSHGLLDPQVEE